LAEQHQALVDNLGRKKRSHILRVMGWTDRVHVYRNDHGEAVLRARGFSEAEVAALALEGVLVEKRRK
jgi:hypothetical protein